MNHLICIYVYVCVNWKLNIVNIFHIFNISCSWSSYLLWMMFGSERDVLWFLFQANAEAHIDKEEMKKKDMKNEPFQLNRKTSNEFHCAIHFCCCFHEKEKHFQCDSKSQYRFPCFFLWETKNKIIITNLYSYAILHEWHKFIISNV